MRSTTLSFLFFRNERLEVSLNTNSYNNHIT